MNARLLLLSCFVVASLAAFARADGLELPQFNPSSPAKQPGKMQLPKLPKINVPKPNIAGAWRTVSGGTKSLLTSTTRMLTPWNKPKRPPAMSPTGYGKRSFSRYQAPEKKKPTFFQAIFSPDKEDKPRPRTVNEFLSKPRVPRP